MKKPHQTTRVCDCSDADLLAELLRRIYRPQQLKEPKECLEVEFPEWFNHDEWAHLHGDAGTANSEFFQVFYRREANRTRVQIWCPEFLRGPLTIDVCPDGVWGSY